mmetsp:Transcript_36773/g.88428  ORF Transcript_36773/g.88428 Transcript_36773/m.88428 type:complete len:82 (+) Transcript_36773:819-1064(+)
MRPWCLGSSRLQRRAAASVRRWRWHRLLRSSNEQPFARETRGGCCFFSGRFPRLGAAEPVHAVVVVDLPCQLAVTGNFWEC